MNPSTLQQASADFLSRPGVVRIDAMAAADGLGTWVAPASILVRLSGDAPPEILAVGRPGEIDAHEAAIAAARVRRPEAIVIPGLVNAHTHLDLTHIGPREHDPERGFMPWVGVIRAERLEDEKAIAATVRRGIELSLAGGTVAVGDIAGAVRGRASLAAWLPMREGPLLGVSFIEFFAIGTGREPALRHLTKVVDAARELPDGCRGTRLGLQPHAPYSVAINSYHAVLEMGELLGLPIATHLAETVEERELIASGRGPMRTFLEEQGIWEASLEEVFGQGLHPVAHMAPVLRRGRIVAAHLNDATDEAVEHLAAAGTSVVYCPRASAYFGADRRFGPHRYREMLAAGVNVALGTDSIVNLPREAADPAQGGMSVLDEMRVLFRRDGTDPVQLLRMGTVNGAAALGLDLNRFSLRPGSNPAGLVAVATGPDGPDPSLAGMLRSSGLPELLFCANSCGRTGISAVGGGILTYDRV